jgi:hypothetical protein
MGGKIALTEGIDGGEIKFVTVAAGNCAIRSESLINSVITYVPKTTRFSRSADGY